MPPAEVLAELRQLSEIYARAMDRNAPELLEDILTDDVVVIGPGFRMEGLGEVQQSPAMLRDMYVMTQHLVHNLTARVKDGEAKGETYSTASHVMKPASDGGGHAILVWAIRYQDRYRLQGGRWRICARTLVVDWSEVRPVTIGPGEND